MSEKPRLTRLTAIITQLQSKRLVTAREIADKHQVSIRTVYRDIRTLEESGIPIITEEDRGYSIMEGYKLPPVMFTEDEANALITAEHLVKNNSDQSLVETYESAIEKIKSILRYSQKDKVELLSERMHVRKYDTSSPSLYLIQLQKAITAFQLVNIEYHSLQGKSTKRDIEPFALIQTKENWILIAYCRLRDAFRIFRLDCIKKLIILHENFTQHDISLQQFFQEQSKKWNP